jgi:predicted MarR family transcription regulator
MEGAKIVVGILGIVAQVLQWKTFTGVTKWIIACALASLIILSGISVLDVTMRKQTRCRVEQGVMRVIRSDSRVTVQDLCIGLPNEDPGVVMEAVRELEVEGRLTPETHRVFVQGEDIQASGHQAVLYTLR